MWTKFKCTESFCVLFHFISFHFILFYLFFNTARYTIHSRKCASSQQARDAHVIIEPSSSIFSQWFTFSARYAVLIAAYLHPSIPSDFITDDDASTTSSYHFMHTYVYVRTCIHAVLKNGPQPTQSWVWSLKLFCEVQSKLETLLKVESWSSSFEIIFDDVSPARQTGTTHFICIPAWLCWFWKSALIVDQNVAPYNENAFASRSVAWLSFGTFPRRHPPWYEWIEIRGISLQTRIQWIIPIHTH